MNDYVSLEYQIMVLISTGRDVSWKLDKQELGIKDGRRYDKLILLVKGITGNLMPSKMEDFYFHLTKCSNMLYIKKQRNEVEVLKIKVFSDTIFTTQ